MTRYIALYFCTLVALFVCSSCQEEEEVLPKGGIALSLTELDVEVGSRSVPADLGDFLPEKFNLEIKNEINQNVSYRGGFTEEIINLTPATYEVKAFCGENVPMGLDAPYFEGTTHGVKVLSQKIIPVTVACKVANSLLSVRYTNLPLFEDLYSSYHVVVRNGAYSVNIENVGQSAYFPAESQITVFFEGILKDSGKKVVIELKHQDIPQNISAGQHIILSLNLTNVQTVISKVEVVKESIIANIPVAWLPKPKLEPMGFSDNSLTLAETENKVAKVNFKLAKPLEDVKFHFAFEDVQFTTLNGRDYFLSNSEDQLILKKIFGEELPQVGEVKANLDFSTLIAKIQTNGGKTTNNSITIDVKANQRWSSEDETVNRDFKIQCVKPQFTVSCYPGHIWTREFTINPLGAENIISGNLEKLKSDLVYQYSADQERWMDYSSDNLRLEHLNPNQVYYVRAVYRGEILSDVTEVKTNEVDHSLDTGFEIWSYEDSPAWFKYWKRWFLNANKDVATEGWCSLNTLTTSNNNSLAYCSNSGTEPSEDCFSGTYSAEVKTIGWGNGTTAASPISVIKMVTPGEVFLGKMSNNNPIYGFNGYRSRPTGVRFYYKYFPKGSHTFLVEISLYSNHGVIASNTFNGGEMTSFMEKTLDFVYDDAKVKEEVIGIKIRFTSGDNTKAEVDVASITPGSRHIGNKLYLDDVTLIYDK